MQCKIVFYMYYVILNTHKFSYIHHKSWGRLYHSVCTWEWLPRGSWCNFSDFPHRQCRDTSRNLHIYCRYCRPPQGPEISCHCTPHLWSVLSLQYLERSQYLPELACLVELLYRVSILTNKAGQISIEPGLALTDWKSGLWHSCEAIFLYFFFINCLLYSLLSYCLYWLVPTALYNSTQHCHHTHSKEVTVDEDLGKINLLNVQPLLEVHTVIPGHEDIPLVNPAHNTH